MSNTNTVEILDDNCAVKPLPTIFAGSALSMGTIRCGLSKPSRRLDGALVGIGRSMKRALDAGIVRFEEGRTVLIPGLTIIVGWDVGTPLRRAITC